MPATADDDSRKRRSSTGRERKEPARQFDYVFDYGVTYILISCTYMYTAKNISTPHTNTSLERYRNPTTCYLRHPSLTCSAQPDVLLRAASSVVTTTTTSKKADRLRSASCFLFGQSVYDVRLSKPSHFSTGVPQSPAQHAHDMGFITLTTKPHTGRWNFENIPCPAPLFQTPSLSPPPFPYPPQRFDKTTNT